MGCVEVESASCVVTVVTGSSGIKSRPVKWGTGEVADDRGTSPSTYGTERRDEGGSGDGIWLDGEWRLSAKCMCACVCCVHVFVVCMCLLCAFF